MAKSLFNKSDSDSIIARANLLLQNSARKWGTMSVTEMLLHCNMVNKNVLENSATSKNTSTKQRIFKYIFLYLIPHFPKNRRGPSRLQTKGLVDDSEFSNTLATFATIITQFAGHNEEISLVHPMFGLLTTEEWGMAMYKHVDHHLRQFGV